MNVNPCDSCTLRCSSGINLDTEAGDTTDNVCRISFPVARFNNRVSDGLEETYKGCPLHEEIGGSTVIRDTVIRDTLMMSGFDMERHYLSSIEHIVAYFGKLIYIVRNSDIPDKEVIQAQLSLFQDDTEMKTRLRENNERTHYTKGSAMQDAMLRALKRK